ncbi:MAG TPA: enoyl-CoA hydratase-related protein, partial [Phototrophicaceae bacterium]|nr:enoyl-CoA hydratase-related protein [Phototrophicaceae bacterium]
AAENAWFAAAFVKIGLVPDSGLTWLLPRLMGAGSALELLLTGRQVSAAEALNLGLVSQVVPDDVLAATVSKLAGDFATAPTRTIGYIKQAVNYALDHTLAESLEQEAELQTLAGKTADHQEGVLAFLQKRPPQFTGQ